MLEITILISEEELTKVVCEKVEKYTTHKIIQNYIVSMVKDKSATFFYGPCNIDEWIKDTISRLTIIRPGHEMYDTCEQLWNSGEFQRRNLVVVYKFLNEYLLEET